MKKIFFAVMLARVSLFAQTSAAQTVFAPPGAEWWYHTLAIGGPYYQRVWAAGDTVLPGHAGTWQHLREQYFWYSGSGVYVPAATSTYGFTQCRGDQVWGIQVWGTQLATETLLLDFALRPGARDTLALCPSSPAGQWGTVWLDSVGTYSWGGATLRTQQWRRSTSVPFDELRQFSGPVVERQGYPYATIFP